MKRRLFTLVVAAIAALAIYAGSAFAFGCPGMIGEGRAKLASVKDKTLRAQVQKLLDRAEAQHNAGSHGASVATAEKALAMLK